MKSRNLIIGTLVILMVAMAVGGALYFKDYDTKQTAKIQLEQDRSDALALKLFQRDSLVNDYVATLNQIENDLLMIKEKENLLDVQSQDPELAKDKKVQISEDIQMIYSLVEKNKKKVADLQRQLRNSGVEIAALNEKVKHLTAAISERDSSLVALNTQLQERDVLIADLNVQKTELETVVEDQQTTIAEQVNELNKAYFASGSYKDLEQKGIITKDGGFLGLGKSISLQDSISTDYFEKIDITQTKSIPVNARKAHLVTEHPAGSYQWVEENEQIASLEINNPQEFWKISKFAVLETK